MFGKKYGYDLIVLGSGAGGDVGANHAVSLGKKVAVFEAGAIGGECPNFACVPTKSLLFAGEVYETCRNAKKQGIEANNARFDYKKIKAWKDLVVSRTGAAEGEKLFKKDGIELIREKARFISPHEVEAGGKIYSAAKFLIATGSETATPEIPGLLDTGYITYKEAVDLGSLPSSIFILGGGAVGCEFAQIFSSFGVKVTIAETFPRLLFREDKEVGDLIQALFENRGIKVFTKITVTGCEKKGSKKLISLANGNYREEMLAEEILIATGKKPVLSFDPEKAGIKIENSRLLVNKYLQTSAPHIFAAGDVIGPYLFTHTGCYQSYIAANNAFSFKKIKPDYRAVPRCVFTKPEVASVGLSEDQAKAMGIKTRTGSSPIAMLGRSNTSDEFDGFVKVTTDWHKTIIGASIVAPRAGEMIHELTLAVHLRLKSSVVADMIHAYPTFSEGIKIACSAVE